MGIFNPSNLGIADMLVSLHALSLSPSLALSSNSRVEHNLVQSYSCSLFSSYWCLLTICWLYCPVFYHRSFAHDFSFSGMLFSLHFSSLTWWTNINSSNDITNFTSSEKFSWPPIVDELPLLYTLTETQFSHRKLRLFYSYIIIL